MALEDINLPAPNPNRGGVGEMAGRDTSLANYIGPYATNMLGRGVALADAPYTPYEGRLTAGQSPLQQQAFEGLANLVVPTERAGAYTPRSFTGRTSNNPYDPIASYNPAYSSQGGMAGNLMRHTGMGGNISDMPAGGYTPEQMAAFKAAQGGRSDGPYSNAQYHMSTLNRPTPEQQPQIALPNSMMQPQNQGTMQNISNSAFGRTINNNLPRRQMPAGFEWLDNGLDDVGFTPAEQDAIIAANPNGLADPSLSSTNPSPVTNNPQVYDNGGAGFASGGTQAPQGQNLIEQYMNPYLQAALNPQLDEARRQSDISAMKNRGRLTRSGAFGGSRQAIMDAEADRNLQQNLSNITGQGYATAYDKAVNLFGQEEDRNRQAQLDVNTYIQNVLNAQAAGGREQRGIESEGIAADIRQFETERDFPYQQLKFQSGLLQGLPTTSYGTPYVQPSSFDSSMSNAGDILSVLKGLF